MSCEFCRDDKSLYYTEDHGMTADISIHGARILAIDLYADYVELPIDFCPMCGDPLSPPQALSLEELRERDGKAVWLIDNGASCWASSTGCARDWIGFRGLGAYAFEDYGKTWLAYDYEPKEDAHGVD